MGREWRGRTDFHNVFHRFCEDRRTPRRWGDL